MIDSELITFLKGDAAVLAIVGDNVAVGDRPADDNGEPLVESYIWLSLFDEVDILDLTGTGGLTRFGFDIECCSVDLATAKTLGQLVKKRLQGYQGFFGTYYIPGVFVESKDDQYIPVNRFAEADLSVVALDVEIVTDDTIND